MYSRQKTSYISQTSIKTYIVVMRIRRQNSTLNRYHAFCTGKAPPQNRFLSREIQYLFPQDSTPGGTLHNIFVFARHNQQKQIHKLILKQKCKTTGTSNQSSPCSMSAEQHGNTNSCYTRGIGTTRSTRNKECKTYQHRYS